ncbi:MAG: hypothetical protein IIY05_04270 [Alistipes sp.]|nr:hypothetical protein [Alistipes sp.]
MAQRHAAPLGKARFVCNVDDLLPSDIQIKGSTQGFAIYGGYAFSMHDKGECVILDIKRKKYINSFVVEGNTGHCNNASFGTEFYSRESQFPLFYVTECRGERACYVNDITLQGSRLVQKIFYMGDEITGPCDWAVDAEQKLLYLYCTIDNQRTLMWFSLPRLSDSDNKGEVHLYPKDALGSISAGDIKIPQGSLIAGDYIFLAEGVPPRHTALNVIDRHSAQRLMHLDLTETGIEPEGIAIYRGWIYLSLHTPRKPRHNIIYRFRLR